MSPDIDLPLTVGRQYLIGWHTDVDIDVHFEYSPAADPNWGSLLGWLGGLEQP